MVKELRWGCLLVVATTGACTGTAAGDIHEPVVADVSPRLGDYGTTITVSGTTLGESSVVARSPDGELVSLLVPGGAGATSKADAGPPPDGAPLTFRFAFPAEGEMMLTGRHADVSLGSFTPSWTPGQPARLEGQRVLGAAVLGAGTVVLVDGPRGASFVVFGAGAPATVPVAPAVRDLTSATLRVVGGTKVEALVLAESQLSLVTFDGAVATSAAYDAVDGNVLGAGVDATGFVVVVQSSGGTILRERGAPPALKQVGAAVPVPATVGAGKGVLGVSGDGTVVHAWSGAAGNLLDDVASFSMSGLAPAANDFSTSSSLGSLDDVFKSIDVVVQGGIVKLSYCAVDSGFFSSPKTVCGSATTIDGSSRIDLGGSAPPGDGAAVFAGDKLTYATCEQNDVLTVHSQLAGTSGAVGEPAVYPCSGSGAKVHAVAASESGTRVIIEQNGKLWVTHRR